MPNDITRNRNRNLFRKVISYRNHSSRKEIYLDTVTQTSFSLDLERTVVDRPYFKIKQNPFLFFFATGSADPIIPVIATYEEGEVVFTLDSADEAEIVLTSSFDGDPIVALSIEANGNNVAWVHPFGFNVTRQDTTASIHFGLSAPFDGLVRYRAIYSPSYPVQVTSPTTGSTLNVYAYSQSLNNQSVSNESYAEHSSYFTSSLESYHTIWENGLVSSSNNANIYGIKNTTPENNQIVFTSNFSNVVHVIVVGFEEGFEEG